jgi:hypothetical protein
VPCVPYEPDFACCDEWESLTPELQERATELAWSTLRTLSGGRVGNCPVTVRPCLGPPCNACTEWWSHSLTGHTTWIGVGIANGAWINCACATPECSCERLCEIVMSGPIASLEEVSFDGTVLPLGNFRVDNGHRIVRTDGECWPSCQNMNAELGEPGTLGITYVPGIVPNAAGLWAAGVLACEFSKACTGARCRLPTSVTAISRQGVSFEMSSGMFVDGMTGIREVDAYLTSINPNAHRIPPMVWSPDVPWAKHRFPGPPTVVINP